jgi:glycosyltransferase involved in cell wall biosynthesis
VTSKDLSVIIPTYNRLPLLERALGSVLAQTVLPQEIIIIDDGSEDSTEQLVKHFKNSSEVKILYHKQPNRGPASARNRGIERSSSTFLAFLDSDDHWHKRKIENQFDELKKNYQTRVSHTREKWLRRGEHLNQKKIHIPTGGTIFNSCLNLCCVGMSTVMLNKSIFDDYGLFDENLRCCEDYDFWLRVSVKERFLLIDSPLTIKEGGREDQVSAIFRVGMDKFRIYSLSKLISQGNLNDDQDMMARHKLVEKCEIYGRGCLKHGKIDEGNAMLELARKTRSAH